VGFARNVCEGIRFLLDRPVSAVLVDSGLLRLPERVRYQVLGFQVLSKPFPVDDLVRKAEALTAAATIRPGR